MKEEQIKECANCGAKVPSYMERCPECGLSQPRSSLSLHSVVSQQKTPCQTREMQRGIQRHPFITFWLWLLLVVHTGVSIVATYCAFTEASSQLAAFYGCSSLCLLGAIVGDVLLLLQYKYGFFTLLIISVVNWIICSIVFKEPVFDFSILVLYAILQLKKNGVRYWKTLK